MEKNDVGKKFEKLVAIMATLRGPDGCPWDKEQTYKDINPLMLEEVHETMEAIDKNDMPALKEELGDLLLHIVFHAQIAKEERHFDIGDVLEGIAAKLIHRHPHVFGDKKVKTSGEVLENWEKLKRLEKRKKSTLEGVPAELPALLKAFRVGEKVGRVGFDWEAVDGILAKLREEIIELNEARSQNNEGEIEHEYGDLLFTLANIGRFLKINPEEALRKSTNRFITRFQIMEEEVKKERGEITDLKAEEWEKLWESAKLVVSDTKNGV